MYRMKEYSGKNSENNLRKGHVDQTDVHSRIPNRTGIPDAVKNHFENASGLSFDDVRVHYHSSKPAQLRALAYTQGNDVYIGPGQERHLKHELGHVVQQKQGRVAATTSIDGQAVNDNEGLEKEADGWR